MERGLNNKMEIIRDFRNDLLKRREIFFSHEDEKNPGFQKTIDNCAKSLKVEADRVVIKKLWNNFGSKVFFTNAFIYDSVKDKENSEKSGKNINKKEAKK